jgi:hypothetical protein
LTLWQKIFITFLLQHELTGQFKHLLLEKYAKIAVKIILLIEKTCLYLQPLSKALFKTLRVKNILRGRVPMYIGSSSSDEQKENVLQGKGLKRKKNILRGRAVGSSSGS